MSNMANFQIQGQRTQNSDSSGPISFFITLIRDLMVIYTLTKFGADWLIFVDATVLTRKLWTDGCQRIVSDHNSSLEHSGSGVSQCGNMKPISTRKPHTSSALILSNSIL